DLVDILSDPENLSLQTRENLPGHAINRPARCGEQCVLGQCRFPGKEHTVTQLQRRIDENPSLYRRTEILPGLAENFRRRSLEFVTIDVPPIGHRYKQPKGLELLKLLAQGDPAVGVFPKDVDRREDVMASPAPIEALQENRLGRRQQAGSGQHGFALAKALAQVNGYL